MMHRFERVGRDCVHKVPLNGFRPNSKVPRAHNSTDPLIKPVHHLFYKLGPQKLSKILNVVILQIYRMHGKIMRPVISFYRTHDFFTGRMILTYHEI